MTGTSRMHAVVTGDVQGVGFRVATRAEAQRAGLSGFVRNADDGSVEVEFEGADAAVTIFAEWLRHGPPGARVDDLKTRELAVTGQAGFGIRR